MANFTSIDIDVPPLMPRVVVVGVGEKVDFDRSTILVFLESLIGLEIAIQFSQRTHRDGQLRRHGTLSIIDTSSHVGRRWVVSSFDNVNVV